MPCLANEVLILLMVWNMTLWLAHEISHFFEIGKVISFFISDLKFKLCYNSYNSIQLYYEIVTLVLRIYEVDFSFPYTILLFKMEMHINHKKAKYFIFKASLEVLSIDLSNPGIYLYIFQFHGAQYASLSYTFV